MYHILKIPRPFSIAIYLKLLKLFFSVPFGSYKPFFETKLYIIIFVYLFFPKNGTVDSRKSSITLACPLVELHF